MAVDPDEWEIVIGLEVHTELATRTKLFCSAVNEFGGEPNTHIDPLTLGLPGSLPVLTEQAVELAIRVGVSVAIFLFVLLAHALGWIEPTGIPAGR